MLQRSYYTPSGERKIMRYACRRGPLYYGKALFADTYVGRRDASGVKDGNAPRVCASRARCVIAPETAMRRETPSAEVFAPTGQAECAPNPGREARAPQSAPQRALAEKAAPDEKTAQIAVPSLCENKTNMSGPEPQKEEAGEKDARACGLFDAIRYDKHVDPRGEGLLYYQKFWHLNDVEISVNGELLRGTTLEFHENTLRLINDTHSYYIPLGQVDYIKTSDGLQTSFVDGRFGKLSPVRVRAATNCAKPKECAPKRKKPPNKKESEKP